MKILIRTSIILIVIIFYFIIGNESIIKEKKRIKEMTQSENEANLQTQINTLNATQEEYANNVQAYKKQIAEAITSQGVTTSENDTGAVIAENIGKILTSKTTATATAVQILRGQTAWVNGNEVVGTMANNGELNWSPSDVSTYIVPEGYYSGGTLDSSAVYNAGYTAGSSDSKIQHVSGNIIPSYGWKSSISGTIPAGYTYCIFQTKGFMSHQGDENGNWNFTYSYDSSTGEYTITTTAGYKYNGSTSGFEYHLFK